MSQTTVEHARSHYISDTFIMLGRSMKHITRSVDTIITTALMPIAIMLMFVYVLGGAIQPEGSYVSYQLPGILLITIASGVSYTSYRLFSDKQRGIFERFHSMPIARSAPLWGQVLTSVISILVSLAIVMLVALLIGFRSSASPLAWLGILGILVLFTLALTWVAVIAGLVAKTPDGAGVFAYPLIFLPFISSAFVPTETMPSGLRIFAENQPVTFVVDAIRSLIASEPAGNAIWVALIWCIGILIVAYLVAVRLYNRNT